MTLANKHPLFAAFLQICLLRRGPQILPASGFLLGLTVALNFAASAACLTVSNDLFGALARAVLDVVVSLALAYLILLAAARRARATQTLTALCGSGAIIGVATLPVLWWAAADGQQGGPPAVLLTLILFWQVAVIGGIFRHALSVGPIIGVLVALGYLFASLTLFSVFSFAR